MSLYIAASSAAHYRCIFSLCSRFEVTYSASPRRRRDDASVRRHYADETSDFGQPPRTTASRHTFGACGMQSRMKRQRPAKATKHAYLPEVTDCRTRGHS